MEVGVTGIELSGLGVRRRGWVGRCDEDVGEVWKE